MAKLPHDYQAFLADVKQRIHSARLKAALSVNRELILLYWSIGHDILARQHAEGWGTKVIDRLAADLRRAFPEMTGISARNLRYKRAFAEAWPDQAIVQQVVAQLPWGHNTLLLDAVKSNSERDWYAHQAIHNGWSRNVFAHQIDSGLLPDKVAHSPTSRVRCQRRSRNSRKRSSRTRTASTFSHSRQTCWSAISSAA